MSLSKFQYQYELSPLFLTGGVAQGMGGGGLPIVALTDSLLWVEGLLGPSTAEVSTDNLFAQWNVLPGSTLLEQEIGEYTFANQAVAANAQIAQPLSVSLLMICPAKTEGSYDQKSAIITALQSTIARHAALGGTWTVSTPAFIWPNCILKRISDISSGESKQVQHSWQWDFEQPLLTLQQLTQVMNNLTGQLNAETPIIGQPAYTGLPQTVGQPQSLAAPDIIPASQSASVISGLRGVIPQ